MKYLASFQKICNAAIFSYVDGHIQEQQNIHKDAVALSTIIKEFIGRGGKKFRPALFYFAYQSYSKPKDKLNILKYSFIFELIHTFALIHDDIIDHAPLRRGKPTVHTQYNLSTAILAGDLALMYADELFLDMSEHVIDLKKKKKFFTTYNQYKQELIIGQYLDCLHIADYNRIIELKTSRYSFVRPVEIAFLLLDAPPELIRKEWMVLLNDVGKLFQIKDDYEGIFGQENSIGKSVTSDIEEKKNTLIVSMFKEAASSFELARFTDFFEKGELTKEDIIWYKTKLKEKKIDMKIKNYISKEAMRLIHICQNTQKKTELQKLVLELLLLIQHVE